MSFKRDICCFDFRSNFLVSISFLINVGKEMSLPGFRKGDIGIAFLMLAAALSLSGFMAQLYIVAVHIQVWHRAIVDNIFKVNGYWSEEAASPFLNLPHFSFLKGKNYFPLSIEFKGKNLLLEEQKFPLEKTIFWKELFQGSCCCCTLFYVHGKHLRSCRDGQLT